MDLNTTFAHVKVLATILAFYTLGIIFFPCSDIDCSSDESISISAEEKGTEGHLDMCSPFCICQCCHISMLCIDNNISIYIPLIFSDQLTYSSPLFASHRFAIWQPPEYLIATLFRHNSF